MTIHDLTTLHDPEAQWSQLQNRALPEHRDALDAAYRLASWIHTGQCRKTAEDKPVPYIVHPLRVARILSEEWEVWSIAALQTSLLHDVLEDCPTEERTRIEREIKRVCGKEVRDAVLTLTKPAPGPAEVKAARDARYFKELFAAASWVRLVKCADRVDNLRDAAAWGNKEFWIRYSSETIGWHLYLARITSPIAEVALFKALVEGERKIRGRVPVWADGYLIDPVAAALIPEHIARAHGVVGLAVRGETLIVGIADSQDAAALKAVRMSLRSRNESVRAVQVKLISREALRDAISAGLYGKIDDTL
jgi:hypothetical protein